MEDLQRFKHKEMFVQDPEGSSNGEVKLLGRHGPSPPAEGNFQQNDDDDDDITKDNTKKSTTQNV